MILELRLPLAFQLACAESNRERVDYCYNYGSVKGSSWWQITVFTQHLWIQVYMQGYVGYVCASNYHYVYVYARNYHDIGVY